MKEEYQEQIDRYLRNDMSPVEMDAFLAMTEENDELSEQLEATRHTQLALGAIDFEQKLDFVKGLEQENDVAKVLHFNRSRLSWILALTGCVLAFFVLFNLLKTDKSYLNDELFIAYPDLLTLRSSEENLLNEAMAFYNEGDYNSAAKKLSSSLKEEFSTETSFYLAICHLANHDFEEAEKILSNLVHNIFPIDYYMGLSLYYQGDVEKAQGYFKKCKNCTDQMLLVIKKHSLQ